MNRVYGHVRDTFDARDWVFDVQHFGALKTVAADSWDYSDHLDAVQDQLGGSCVGQSIASSAYLRGQVSGHPIKRPSALFAYTIARLFEAPKQPLVDEGCQPRLAMLGLKSRGLIASGRWDETPTNLAAMPPLDAFRAGEFATLDAFYRIPDTGDVRAAVCTALAAGYLPIFGMAVDTKYENIGSRIYDGPGGSDLGNHCQCIVGYDAKTDTFLVLNSWGTSFGNGGFSRITASFIATSTFDKWVLKQSPPEVL